MLFSIIYFTILLRYQDKIQTKLIQTDLRTLVIIFHVQGHNGIIFFTQRSFSL